MTVLGISTAIVYIALDTRLGCLDANLAPDSEPQKMIDSVQVQFDSFHKLEFAIPVWKYVGSPTWRKFVKASDVFVECVLQKSYVFSHIPKKNCSLIVVILCPVRSCKSELIKTKIF